MALGRAHASWFIIYSRPYAMRMLREDQCVNFIVPGDSSTVSPYFSSPGTKPRFTIGGGAGQAALSALLALRDEQERAGRVGERPGEQEALALREELAMLGAVGVARGDVVAVAVGDRENRHAFEPTRHQ